MPARDNPPAPDSDSGADTDTSAAQDIAARRTEYDVPDPAAPAGQSRGLLIAAVALPLLLIIGVLVGARLYLGRTPDPQDTPLAVVGLPSPDAESEQCRALIDALPDAIGDAKRVQLRDPAPPATAGYRTPDGEPITVQCGVEPPPGFVVGAALQQVNEVQWFSEADPEEQITSNTYVAVDRPVFVALTMPDSAGTGVIQDVSDHIAAQIPATEPKPAPVG